MVRALTSAPDVSSEPSTALTRSSLYRAVWRWHFYAGLLVLPLLIWLAVTGALFVYHRSRKATASDWPVRWQRSMDCCTRSASSTRLGSPVRAS